VDPCQSYSAAYLGSDAMAFKTFAVVEAGLTVKFGFNCKFRSESSIILIECNVSGAYCSGCISLIRGLPVEVTHVSAVKEFENLA
jgi:hypothetical protein